MLTDNKSNAFSRGESTESTTNMMDMASESDKDATEEENETPYKSLSFGGKVKYIMYNIRVEVLLLFHITFYMCSDVVISSLMLQKACTVDLGFPDSICQNLSEKNKTGELAEAEVESQKVVTSINAWKPAVENAVPIAFVLFMGSWSDRHGRKMCMIIPMVGFILKQIGLLLSVVCQDWRAQSVILAGYIPVGITGSLVAFSMAVNSYVIDHCTLARRTFRIGALNACIPIGVSIGMSAGGALLKSMGYVGIFAMGIVAESLCFIYITIFIYDIKRAKPTENGNVFMQGINNLVDVFRTLCKKREHNNNVKLVMLLLVLFVAFWPMIGESSIMYLFVQKHLDWSVEEFGYYVTLTIGFIVLGSVVTMVILVKKLNWADEVVGIISVLSMIASNLWLAFASTTWMMFLGPVIGTCGGTVLFLSRVMPTKLVEKHEIGKLNGAIAVMETTAPLIATPVYTGLYYATLDTFPGAFFLLTAATGMLPLLIYAWLVITNRRQAAQRAPDGEKHLSESIEEKRF